MTKSSSIHVTNINRAFKNIKSNIIIDYIWPEATGVTIVTNNIVSAADLQVIENYVKKYYVWKYPSSEAFPIKVLSENNRNSVSCGKH